eukprot:7393442-Ditylum_brightwellii.AAC.1
MDEYNLHDKVHNKYIYMEIRCSMYGLPQAGKIANNLLKQCLATYNYHETHHTSGLWKHTTNSNAFTLVVDDFGIKYIGTENIEHLINALKKYYTVKVDIKGSKYCSITLNWDYNHGTLDVSMPGYIATQCKKINHPNPAHPQHCPFPPPPRKFGKKAQLQPTPNTTPAISPEQMKRIQQIVGALLYYSCSVDSTTNKALNSLGMQQNSGMEHTKKNTTQLLNYMAAHPEATIWYYTLDMILNIHPNASYLSKKTPEALLVVIISLDLSHKTINQYCSMEQSIHYALSSIMCVLLLQKQNL